MRGLPTGCLHGRGLGWDAPSGAPARSDFHRLRAGPGNGKTDEPHEPRLCHLDTRAEPLVSVSVRSIRCDHNFMLFII